MSKYKELETKDWMKYIWVFVGYLVLNVVVTLILPSEWAYLLLITLLGPVPFMMRWGYGISAYKCNKCGHKFQPTFWQMMFSFSGIWRNKKEKTYEWRYMKCPKCREWSEARLLVVRK